MADTVDEKLKTIAERHVRALAEDMPLQAQLLILDAHTLLDQKMAAAQPAIDVHIETGSFLAGLRKEIHPR